jgi:hypothetical protein
MGIAAAAAAATIAGTAVAAGTSIYGAVSAGDNTPQGQAGAYNAALKKLAQQYLGPYLSPGAWDINIPGMAQQSLQFGLQNAPAVNQANMQQLQALLGQALPGYQQAVGKSMANIQSQLSGQLPADVINQIQRSSAFGALRGGFAGTGAAQALTARDLGLTSLQLTQQGEQGLQGMLGASRYLMPQPVNPMSLLPLNELIQTNQWSKVQQYNATANYLNMRTQGLAAQLSAPYQSNVGAIGSGISGLLGALGATNPQTGQSVLGNLAYGFGQMTGSNYNPYFNQNWADQAAQSMGYSDYNAAIAAGAI